MDDDPSSQPALTSRGHELAGRQGRSDDDRRWDAGRRRLLVGLGALALGSGCGRVGERPAGATRIVSTSPSMTEMIFALGRGDVQVGRSSFCDTPAEALKIEVVGGFSDPNVERIVALAPTLVCGERGPAGPELPASLERHGLTTYFPVMDRIDEVAAALGELGAKLGVAARGTEQADALRASIQAVRSAVAGREPPRVVFLFDWKPLVAAGPGGFPDEILAAAGGKNCLQEGTKYPKLSTEGLLALDPDVIIDGSAGVYAETPIAIVKTIPGLEALRAGKTGRLFRLEGTAALRPGPRLGKGIGEVARLLHVGLVLP